MRFFLLLFTFLLAFYVADLSANEVEGCRVSLGPISDKRSGIYQICREFSSDGESIVEVYYRLTVPKLTFKGVCTFSRERLYVDMKPVLYAASSIDEDCPDLLLEPYVSLEYINNSEEVFQSINAMLVAIVKQKKIDIPLYKRLFCDDCSEFSDSLNWVKDIVLSSISYSERDEGLMVVRVVLGRKKWVLYVDDSFSIVGVEKRTK